MGWITLLVAAGVACCSDAEITWDGLIIVSCLTISAGVWCGVRLLVALVRLWRFPEKGLALGWCGDALVIGVSLFAYHLHVFTLPRFLASRPALTTYVESQMEESRGKTPKEIFKQRREDAVGSFTIRHLIVSEAKDGSPQALVITVENTVTDAAGFAYVPSGAEPLQPSGFGPCYFEHLLGFWWLCRLDY
ncbi:hypothetical protein [Prosthecobacter sp.]|uniref:hypothetical protein n=1 Tax=Prosthecobacter sp. TaxID=1965333 RepID=UPI0037830489